MDWQALIGAGALCYLLGSVPFSYLIARFKNIDIRQHGSGNVGATNVTRVVGVGYGALALIGDMGKGVAAAWFTSIVNVPLWLSSLAVVGHNWSIWLKFRGGKGVATTLGLLLFFSWPALLVTVGIWVVTVLLTRYVAVGSMMALVLIPGVLYLFGTRNFELIGLFGVLGLLTVWQHRSNIQRISQGTEGQIFKKRAE
ncbi:MAG: glycerol-3-phosphate 1-O-acyltransferase PlsY [Candidatus Bipolaricaulota bacterium]|nr:glycerol-3-phosphate 1-O-acyltransferase PlsY [Candidatus Bipolaricaulota bacterium]MDW8030697.1 glycerol-3-phosphate 1-O-acyltransferase PlsY [Candidatus Bipolaricaulota bacterium]